MKLVQFLTSVARDDQGVTAIEYALLGSLIAVGIAGAVGLLGTTVRAMFLAVAGAFP